MSRLPVLMILASMPSAGYDEASDRQAIRALISEFNQAERLNDMHRLLQLFAKDGDFASGPAKPEPATLAIQKKPAKRLPWDERLPLVIKIQSVRFIRPDVAMVDALQSDKSPMLGTTRLWSCVFVVVHTEAGWKIASFREQGGVE